MNIRVPEQARFVRVVPSGDKESLPGRIYIGDEFCERRLPSDEMLSWLERRVPAGVEGVTLMTPFLTDKGLARAEKVLERLSRVLCEGFEVVVNDLGMLELLRQRGYPGARAVCGRILSSRYMSYNEFPDEFLQFLDEHRMRRIELNSVEHLRATHRALRERGIGTHFHWPYMYLTVTRYCATDTGFAGYPRDSIASCRRGCERFLGVNSAQGAPGIVFFANASMVRHEGLTAPPLEADRVVYDGIPLGL